ncbi:MAG TPA: hypothetical protein QGF02_01340 [Candidatus Babeliales bacterium]|nr:hypothetical protein [Candidatus Babeliales bacterium]
MRNLRTFIGVFLLLQYGVIYSGMKCNGHEEFCSKRINEITQILSHNSTTLTKPIHTVDYRKDFNHGVSNQLISLEEQLKAGIRAFKLPVHYSSSDMIAGLISEEANKQIIEKLNDLINILSKTLSPLNKSLSENSNSFKNMN